MENGGGGEGEKGGVTRGVEKQGEREDEVRRDETDEARGMFVPRGRL